MNGVKMMDQNALCACEWERLKKKTRRENKNSFTIHTLIWCCKIWSNPASDSDSLN